MRIKIDEKTYEVQLGRDSIVVDGNTYSVRVEGEGANRKVVVNERPYAVTLELDTATSGKVLVDAKYYNVAVEGRPTATPPPARTAPKRAAPARPGAITAPIAGRVVRVLVSVGDQVKEGDTLLILEAMKMENEIHAPKEGVVQEVAVVAGARVSDGDVLVVVQ